ncbi:sulfatase-like hydrolase/transferase [Halohasta litorea]|uniref:Sulfatase-like hydrolase/transferase n=1 Tax=Halohasta litorea TaxID=869891 RepID=A0ABD6D4G1_9EURY|nr:sulfatase-like hydrolase/transferase [Halohasta litorea]
MTRQPNIFILSVDSLPYASFQEASERIASLVDGVNFTQAVAPASFTGSSMPAITTGSLTDEVPAWGLPESGEPTPIAEVLAEHGYACGLWTDNYLFGEMYNYDRGFTAGNLGRPGVKKRLANVVRETPLSRFFWLFETAYFGLIEPLLSASSGEESFYRPAQALNEQALNWLESREKDAPVFCWLHYMDTHHPYQPPSSYLDKQSFSKERSRSELGKFTREAIKSNGEELSAAEQADLKTAFEASCAYTADQLPQFIEQLQESGHYDPDIDILVVTADHGEVLDRSKYGMLGHVPPAFWEEIIRVPLIIGHPDWETDTVAEQVSLLDLKTTILAAAGVTDDSVSPSDLFRTVTPVVSEWDERDDSVTTYRGLRRADGRKLFGAKRDGVDTLVATEVGSTGSDTVMFEGTPDVSHEELPEWAQELRDELSSFGDAVEPNSTPEDVTVEVDKQHLKNLGYIE